MLSNKNLTIIIPTYNMQEYLQKCLSSLIVKKGLETLEVLVVNDGSKDNSSIIAHEFEAKYPGVFRVIDKENGNYGSCINRGLKEATGKYVKVLDADDSFDTANFEYFLNQLGNIDVDLVISNFVKVDAEGNKDIARNLHIQPNKKDEFSKIANKSYIQGLWMHEIAYRRQMLLDMDYQQTEGISFTDVQWGFKPMARVKSYYFIDKVIYLYLVGRDGQTIDKATYFKKIPHEFLCTKGMLEFYAKVHNDSSYNAKLLHAKLTGRIIALYKRVLIDYSDVNNQAMKDFDEALHTLSPEIYSKLGKKQLSAPLLPFSYIKLWRKNPQSKMLQTVLALYRKMHHIE